jgi:hypothetical protein
MLSRISSRKLLPQGFESGMIKVNPSFKMNYKSVLYETYFNSLLQVFEKKTL